MKNDLSSQLAAKDQELRQCTNAAAQLQAILQLKEADRNRLLEITTVEPPLRLTYKGMPLKGKVLLLPEHVLGNCMHPIVWMENTGTRDVRVAGGEVVTPAPFVSSAQVQPISEGATTVFRHFIDFAGPITPGGRRWTPVEICKGGPFQPSEEIPVRLAIFSEGFLPLRQTFDLQISAP